MISIFWPIYVWTYFHVWTKLIFLKNQLGYSVYGFLNVLEFGLQGFMKNHHILIQFFLLGSVRPLKSIMWLSFPFSFIKDLGSISGLLFFLISLVKLRSEFKLSRTFYYFFNDCYGPIVSISALIFYIFCMSRNSSVSCIFYMLLTIDFQSIF